MKQDEINKDLDSYIHTRKERPFWHKITNHKIKPKYKEEEMESAIKHEIEHVKEEENHHLSHHDKKEFESMEHHVHEINKTQDSAKKLQKDMDEVVEATEAAEELKEEMQEVVEQADEEREGVLKKFFKKLNFSKEDDDFDEAPKTGQMGNNPEITMDDTELRELLHGLHNWIIQLPADKLERFKDSKEFELYTKYLRKHNLIR